MGLFKWSFGVFGKEANVLVRLSDEKTRFHYGIGNRTSDGRYVLMLDYDHTPITYVQEEVRLLQESPFLGDAYLFKTKNGFHVIFLEKLLLGQVVDFMKMTTCDARYRDVPMMYGRKVWVLRQSKKKDEKKEYLGKTVSSSSGQKSRAHAEYLSRYCDVPRKDFESENDEWDHSERVIMAYYYVSERNN
jgi:hypothetical protein